jgi:hypothetical protein
MQPVVSVVVRRACRGCQSITALSAARPAGSPPGRCDDASRPFSFVVPAPSRFRVFVAVVVAVVTGTGLLAAVVVRWNEKNKNYEL